MDNIHKFAEDINKSAESFEKVVARPEDKRRPKRSRTPSPTPRSPSSPSTPSKCLSPRDEPDRKRNRIDNDEILKNVKQFDVSSHVESIVDGVEMDEDLPTFISNKDKMNGEEEAEEKKETEEAEAEIEEEKKKTEEAEAEIEEEKKETEEAEDPNEKDEDKSKEKKNEDTEDDMDGFGPLMVDETDETAKKASNLNTASDDSASDSFSSSDKENSPNRANQRHDSL